MNFLRLRINIILGTAAVVLALAAYATLYLISPTYSAATSIMLDPSEVRAAVEAKPTSDFEQVIAFQSQIDIAKSAGLAAEVVDELHLADRRALSRIDRLKLAVRDLRRWAGETFGVRKWQKKRDPRSEAIAALIDNLEVESKPQSVVIKLVYRAHDPDEAANTVNTLVNHYRTYFHAQLRKRAGGVVAYLEGQRRDVGDQLLKSEIALEEFRAKDRLALGSAPGGAGLVGIVDSQKTQDALKAYILLMEEDLRKMEERYAPSYPPIRELKAKLNQYVSTINELPKRDLQLQRLQREHDMAQESYKYIQLNLERARLTEQGNAASVGMISVLEPAVANDTPVSPKPKLMLPLALVVGLGLGVVLAAAVHYLDQRVYFDEDIEQRLGLRVLGSVS